ncbi:MAG: hypothetical protein JOY92_09365 [Verrucomicrobia bacterium]|nr:hypothetical protein [Verrucomicrobiota bacterium]
MVWPQRAALLILFLSLAPARGGWLDQFRAWQSQQSTRTAAQALKDHKLDEATVAARRAIQLDPNNAEAIDVMAQLSALVSPDEAVKWRERLTELSPQSPDAWLGLAEAAVKARKYQTADRALNRVPEPARSLRFFRDAGSLALAVNNRSQAVDFFSQAAAAPEATNADRFNLDALELSSGQPDRAAAAKAGLTALSADPALAQKCHRLLASFDVSSKDFAGAEPHVDYLLHLPQVQFEDVLIALDLFLVTDRTKFDQLLHNCVVRFRAEPLPASEVVRWLNAKNLLAEAQATVSGINPQTANDPNFKAALADTFVRKKDWAGLKEWCKDPGWGINEYLRVAYDLKARRELGGVTTSETLNAWRESLAKTGQHAECVSILFHLALGWGWRNEAESALWAAADASSDRREALEALWRWYAREHNTQGLFRVANRLLEFDFNDRTARNNVVMLGSLLGIKNGSFLDWARDNWENDRDKHPQFGTTYAFTLFEKGNLENAAQVLAQLNPDVLNNPDDALYAGIIKAALGQQDDARRLLEVAARGDLLPEEKELLIRSRSSLASEAPLHSGRR